MHAREIKKNILRERATRRIQTKRRLLANFIIITLEADSYFL